MTLNFACALEGHEDRVWCCAWNPTYTILASSSSDKSIRLWTKIHQINEETKNNSKVFAINYRCIQKLEYHDRTVRCISWHPSGNIFASASFDSCIGIWKQITNNEDGSMIAKNMIEYECIELLEGHENEVKSVAWQSSGILLASCSRDKSIWIWEMNEDHEFEVIAVKKIHSADVKSVAWHPNYEILLSCSYDNTIKSMQNDSIEDDWYTYQTLKKHTSTVWNLSFNANGSKFVSCSDDKSIAIWKQMTLDDIQNKANVENGIQDYTLINESLEQYTYTLEQTLNDVHSESIYCVDWLKCSLVDIIVTCSGDNCIKFFYCLNDGQWQLLMVEENAHEDDINWIEFGNEICDGIYLIASASDDGMVKLWTFNIEEILGKKKILNDNNCNMIGESDDDDINAIIYEVD